MSKEISSQNLGDAGQSPIKKITREKFEIPIVVKKDLVLGTSFAPGRAEMFTVEFENGEVRRYLEAVHETSRDFGQGFWKKDEQAIEPNLISKLVGYPENEEERQRSYWLVEGRKVEVDEYDMYFFAWKVYQSWKHQEKEVVER